jgi:hypothetical protein
MRESLLLPRLLARAKPEDLVTEMLAFLLERSAPLRSRFLSSIWPDGASETSADPDTILTQQTAQDGGRYDLHWEGPTHVVVVEVKLWAGFTERQPVDYVRQLLKDRRSKRKAFVLLSPSNREKSLRQKAAELLGAARLAPVTWEREIGIVGSCRLVSMTWTKVDEWLGAIAAEELDALERRYLHEVSAVTQLFEHRFGPPLGQSSGKTLGTHLRDLGAVIWMAQEHLKSLGVEVGNLGAGDHEGLYSGFYITSADRVQAWFGLWALPWSQFGNTPLWLHGKGSAGQWLRGRAGDNARALSPRAKDIVAPVPVDPTSWDNTRDGVLAFLEAIFVR